MDINQPLDQSYSGSLTINGPSRAFLEEAAKWAKFIAIFGFVLLGLSFIGVLSLALYMHNSFGDEMSLLQSIFVYIFSFSGVLIMYFPLMYLYRFASNTRISIAKNDSEGMNTAFSYLKSYFKFFGIYIIIFIGMSIFSMVRILVLILSLQN